MKINDDIGELLRHGYELIPIKPDRKIPLLTGWRSSAPLTVTDIKKYDRVGVRLRAKDLVIDVDPRNGGSVAALEKYCRCSTARYPRVETPGGGWHIYMTLPAGCGKVRHVFKDLPGVEFKSSGRFVVAPGCSGYEWDIACPKLPAPILPDSMTNIIVVSELVAGDDGEWSPAELAAALDGLDPADFREHDDWFQLMCACHEATGGLGLEEFAQWSTSDEMYAEHAGLIASRWSSLAAGRESNAGVGTLLKVLTDHGADAPTAVRARAASSDFEELAGEKPVIELSETLMDKMTKAFQTVDEDGKLRVYARRHDTTLDRLYWVRYARKDFIEVCKSVNHLPMVQCGQKSNGDPRYEEAAVHWLDHHRKKRTYKGLAFMPEHAGDKTPDGKLNLWQGFSPATRETPGTWNYLKEVMFDVLCDSDLESYEYVFDWMARAVQKPWETGGTAVVFKGRKGTGKGTLGRAFARLFGQHGMHITSQALLTGRFNMHLRDVCALFADEAFWAGDKSGEAILKGLITEPAIAYEGKGTNAETGRNCIHIIMASNEQWVVPAGMDGERRFAVFQVEENGKPRDYWGKLIGELKSGGYAAMLRDLMARDVSEFDVFDVPRTAALAEQKTRTMEPVAAWLYQSAQENWDDFGGSENGHPMFLTSEVYASFLRYCDRRSMRGQRASETALGMALKKYVPRLVKRRAQVGDGRQQRYFYELPEASDVVKLIEEEIGVFDLPTQGKQQEKR